LVWGREIAAPADGNKANYRTRAGKRGEMRKRGGPGPGKDRRPARPPGSGGPAGRAGGHRFPGRWPVRRSRTRSVRANLS